MESADIRNSVPFRVVLKRFAVPESVVEPANVVMPAVAVNVPTTVKFPASEKLFVVVMLPETFSALKAIVPAPAIFLPAPLRVMVPALAVSEPLTVRSSTTLNEAAVLALPETVSLANVMPLPAIALLVPLIVTAPAPPGRCKKVPAPVVLKSPATFRLVFASVVMPERAMIRLKKLFDPLPVRRLFTPFIVSVLALPVNVPLFVQLAPTEWAKVLPLKVVAAPSVT